MSATERRWINVADTAKLVRKALKAEFPGVTFSVRSSRYAGGASIDVGWQDGPTDKMVGRVTGKYTGASFDGMIDLKSYHDSTLDGEVVHFGADYIFTRREYSTKLLTQVIEKFRREYGVEATITSYGGVDVASHEYGDERRFFALQQSAYANAQGEVVAYVEVR